MCERRWPAWLPFLSLYLSSILILFLILIGDEFDEIKCDVRCPTQPVYLLRGNSHAADAGANAHANAHAAPVRKAKRGIVQVHALSKGPPNRLPEPSTLTRSTSLRHSTVSSSFPLSRSLLHSTVKHLVLQLHAVLLGHALHVRLNLVFQPAPPAKHLPYPVKVKDGVRHSHHCAKQHVPPHIG